MIDIEMVRQRIQPLFPGLMGVDLVEVTPDAVAARLAVRPDLCTAGDILHGGAIMAFADTLGAIGTVVNLPSGTRTTTIESGTRFLAAAPVGSVVTGRAVPLHRGRTTMVWQTEIRTEAGKLCAVVTQTQLVMSEARTDATR